MKRIVASLALLGLVVVFFSVFPACPRVEQPEKTLQLELFGIPLKSATRDNLRQAFKRHGLLVIREDDKHWIDAYDARGVLTGASVFIAGYVDATNRFAFAAYTFTDHKDTQLVSRVVELVSMKYGRPSAQSGDYELGPVSAEWDMGQGMGIMVCRGWPDSTTALIYRDATAYKEMRAEMESEGIAQERQRTPPQEKSLLGTTTDRPRSPNKKANDSPLPGNRVFWGTTELPRR